MSSIERHRSMTVHVVNDDPVARRSVSQLLRSRGYIVQAYDSGIDFLNRIGLAERRGDLCAGACILLDLADAGMSSAAVQRAIAQQDMGLPVVVVSGEADVSAAVRIMKAGAVDLVQKPYTEEVLLAVVGAAVGTAIAAERPIAGAADEGSRLATLTARERDVLVSIVMGYSNKLIAHSMGISPRTVEIHRSNLMGKLGCRGVVDVVRLGLRAGLG